ncbi:MAG: hypothetical protein DWI57_15495 [Chloroflexi bacterium]|nr:MAG: hypothetical protein DWI57_15495 [Chloroflexota bacterium]
MLVLYAEVAAGPDGQFGRAGQRGGRDQRYLRGRKLHKVPGLPIALARKQPAKQRQGQTRAKPATRHPAQGRGRANGKESDLQPAQKVETGEFVME